ncbi:TetR/AcrR family transcriptional regulator [Arthrobacter sp. UYEF3]|uniref:TetR/AcrR family transcriptional regulator n=1 Tax=Arthrobacter sp. UYEF3 TaxID=1756365 RepID=UPI003399A505
MAPSHDPFSVVRASQLPLFKEPVRQAVITAAENAFYKNGYHGTTMRSISSGAGVTVGAPYYHYDSKQEILREIMDRFMRWSLQTTIDACAAAGEDPYSQLVAAVRSHVYQHATHQVPSFVVDNELRSLEPENREQIIQLRDQIQGIFTQAVQRGHEQRIFRTPYPRESARAVVTMCTSVASWFKVDGPLSAVDVAERYTTICLDAVRYASGSEAAALDVG